MKFLLNKRYIRNKDNSGVITEFREPLKTHTSVIIKKINRLRDLKKYKDEKTIG